MAQAALKVIRPVIRFSSFVSPKITGKLAFRLFCTPVGHAPVKEASPAIQRARALFAKAEQRAISYGSGFVHTAWFTPEHDERGSVLVLHGWTGQSLFMAGFVEPLLAAGFRVIAVDLPAHGRSSGRLLNFPIAIEALSAVVRAEAPLAGIVAHSFGGAIAMAAVAGGVAAFAPIPARRLVTIAAPKAMQGYGRRFSAALGLNARGLEAFEAQVLAIAGRPMDSFSGVDYLARSQVPTLVLHAPDDKEIPFADAEALAGAGPHVTLRPMPGLGHRRILSDRTVQQAAAAFIAGDCVSSG